MMHLEQEKLFAQLAEAETLVAELQRIEPKYSSVAIQLGTLVFTDKANFLITAGLGRVRFENGDYFVVSAQSPVAQAMIGRKSGEEFVVNGTHYQIKSIE
jgi:transcription elongation GreA/GreB family factor